MFLVIKWSPGYKKFPLVVIWCPAIVSALASYTNRPPYYIMGEKVKRWKGRFYEEYVVLGIGLFKQLATDRILLLFSGIYLS
jgi:hypothetical protein